MKTRFLGLSVLFLFAFVLLSFNVQANRYYQVNCQGTLGPCAFSFSGVIEVDNNGNIVHGSGFVNSPCGSGPISWMVINNPQGIPWQNSASNYTFSGSFVQQPSFENGVFDAVVNAYADGQGIPVDK